MTAISVSSATTNHDLVFLAANVRAEFATSQSASPELTYLLRELAPPPPAAGTLAAPRQLSR